MTHAKWFLDDKTECLWYSMGWKVKKRLAVWHLILYINLYGTNGQDDG